jgi:arabinofuranan 3-O-arabinosyltransferase
MATLEDRIFIPRCVQFCVTAVILFYVVILAGLFSAGKWVVDEHGTPLPTDFVTLWAAGRAALSDNPALPYDSSAFPAIEARVVNFAQIPGRQYNPFIYPPTMFFVALPLGKMTYTAAFFVWVTASLCLYLIALYKTLPHRLTMLAALASPAVFLNICIGQSGFLAAGLIGLSLIALERRPILAGVAVGLLTCKPQFGLIFPLVLAVSGRWRTVVSAAATAAVFCGAAAVAFGPETWVAFWGTVHGHAGNYLAQEGLPWGMLQTVFGLVRWLGAGATVAATVQLTAAVAVATLVCLIWRRPVPYPLKAAALAVATLLVTPYAFHYDLAILSVAGAFFLKDCLTSGFMSGERIALFVLFAALFFSAGVIPLGPLLNLPVGPIVCAAFMGLVVRRVHAEQIPRSSLYTGQRAELRSARRMDTAAEAQNF